MRIVFFAPHALHWLQAFPEAVIADALRREGHEIIYVTCGTLFSAGCVAMGARVGVDSPAEERAAVCRSCTHNASRLREVMHFEGRTADEMLDASDIAAVDAQVGLLDREQPEEFVVDGVPVGKYAAYELLLHSKRGDLAFNDKEWRAYRTSVRNTLLSQRVAGKVLDEHRPDRVVMFNTLYSVNGPWRTLCARRGVGLYSLELGWNLHRRSQRVQIARDNNLAGTVSYLEAWPRVRDIPCGAEELARVTEHFRVLFGGRHFLGYSAGSAGEDIRARWKVPAGKKLVVAAMSSADELVAARLVNAARFEQPCFGSQLEWADALLRWAEQRDDVFLALRVHPREFANKREGAKSAHAFELERRLRDLPTNAVVNWPDDKISLYDLYDESDVVVTAWSSAGKEAAALGLPVVSFAPRIQLYPAELHLSADTQAGFFARLDEALGLGFDLERVRALFRWYVFEGQRASFSLADANPCAPGGSDEIERAVRRAAWAVAPDYQQVLDLVMRKPASAGREIAKLLESGAVSRPFVEGYEPAPRHVTLAEETVALKRELRRLLTFFAPRGPRPGTLSSRMLAALDARD